MQPALKKNLKKWGGIIALGTVLIALEKGCTERENKRTQAQTDNDLLVELADKTGLYTVSSEYTDKDRGYYSGIVNNIFTNAEVIMNAVYFNKERRSVNESLEKVLAKMGYSKNEYAFFIKNYGSYGNEKIIHWVLRFGRQSEAAKQIRDSHMKGLVPRTQDGQFWRYVNNSVNNGFFRSTFAKTKSYQRKNDWMNKEKDLICPVVYYSGR